MGKIAHVDTGGREVPCCDIEDEPRFPFRGISLDVSRHFYDVDYIKQYINWLFMEKLNVFHWHLTDDVGWRVEIKNMLTHMASYYDCDVKVVNPVDYYNFNEKRHKSEKEVMQFDLSLVKKSDIVIVNLDGINTSIGTSMELYECYRSNIPVIAFSSDEEYENIHPWIRECITRHESNMEDAATYIKDFYMT